MKARFWLAAVLAGSGVVPAWGQDHVVGEGESVRLTSVLVRAGAGRNVAGLPVVVDPVQAALAGGTWEPPLAGEVWERVEADGEGVFRDRRLAGGYAFARVESDRERVMLLRAAGHGMVYVNGEPRAGDVYSHGYLALPVRLRAGENTLLFAGGRGQLRAVLEACPEVPFVVGEDAMLPDLADGVREAPMSVVVVNPTESPAEVAISVGLSGGAGGAGGERRAGPRRVVPAMSVTRAQGVLVNTGRAEAVEVALSEGDAGGGAGGDKGGVMVLPIRYRVAGESRRVTFVSEIDGSVQYYAVRSATGIPEEERLAVRPNRSSYALVLTLHGASVEATGQVDAYASKTWAHLVAPTNRRPFGFDWEDWGRLDALEVLEHARGRLRHEPTRIYLTGHSMGGHGTWHLAANHPGLFAAAAPSAGWIAFATYSPGRAASPGAAASPSTAATQPAGATQPAEADPIRAAFRGASLPSDTFALERNLAPTGLLVLHGDADDNVPVGQARMMAERLRGFHSDWRLIEQPGAGHWWDDNPEEPGAACVDHPAIFDLFSRRRLPGPGEVREVRFVTANPGVHARTGYAEILQQEVSGQLSGVDLRWDPHTRRVIGTTDNVAALRLHVPLGSVTLDGQEMEVNGEPRSRWEEQAGTVFRRTGAGWAVGAAPGAGEKSPVRSGPLKLALQNRMVFVYPTRGTAEENAAGYALARFHAETWHYRAAGSVEMFADTELPALRGRTVVLYGNEETNAAWGRLLADSPIRVSRGGVEVGGERFTGDLSAFFCRPLAGGERGMVVAFGHSSVRAARAHARVPVFASGIAFPDYVVMSAETLSEGAGGVLAAGFFGNRWELR